MLLRCKVCGEALLEEDVDWKAIRGYSDSYGMGGVGPTDYIEVCPNCGAEEMFEEVEEDAEEEVE